MVSGVSLRVWHNKISPADVVTKIHFYFQEPTKIIIIIMAESYNFNRLVKLLARGGASSLRCLLEKCTADETFSDYLYQNQVAVLNLKLNNKQGELVAARNIEDMDITLLSKLTLGLFSTKITEDEKRCINALRNERDKFMHSTMLEAARLSMPVFERNWQIISMLLLDFADAIGDQRFKDNIQEFINLTKAENPDFSEIYEVLSDWCKSSKELNEKFEKVARSVEQLEGTFCFNLFDRISTMCHPVGTWRQETSRRKVSLILNKCISRFVEKKVKLTSGSSALVRQHVAFIDNRCEVCEHLFSFSDVLI